MKHVREVTEQRRITGKKQGGGRRFLYLYPSFFSSFQLGVGGARCEEGQGVIKASMLGKGFYGLICVLTRDGYYNHLGNHDTNKPRCI